MPQVKILAETPYLDVSRSMGKIFAGCVVLVVIVIVVKKIKGKR